MNGTNHSTSGLRRITWPEAPIRLRLFIFVLSLALGAFVVAWIKTITWRQVGRLHQEFVSIQADRFSLAGRVQVSIPKLNDMLLDFRLRRDPTNRDNFLREAQSLNQWLEAKKSSLGTENEREAFQRMEVAYDRYLKGAARYLSADNPGMEEQNFSRLYETLEDEAHEMLAAADSLSRAQNEAFAVLLQDSEQTLLRLQGLLKLSLILLLTLAIFLAVLGYRGMIAPLRSRLSESRAIIERQEKLASLGVLAAGVAHEIRNPLTAIKLRLFSLNNSLPAVSDNEDAKVIQEEINRLDRIVKDFLQFARPSEPELISLPAERILQQAIGLLKSHLQKSGIELKSESSGATWVHADPQQIEQVLINLIQNAADSIGRNGTITLRIKQGTAKLDGRMRSSAILEVTDTGKGIPPDVEKRLFDPFFTTKEGGTGLGLATAARIIGKHGGLLRYRTKLNHGTTFEIVLPGLDHDAT